MKRTAIVVSAIALILLYLTGCKAEISGSYSSKPVQKEQDEPKIYNIQNETTRYYTNTAVIEVVVIEGHKYLIHDGASSGTIIHAQSCNNPNHILINEGR